MVLPVLNKQELGMSMKFIKGRTCLSIVVFYLTKLMGGINTCILMKGLSVKVALLRHLHHGTILKNRLCRVMDELSLVDIVK